MSWLLVFLWIKYTQRPIFLFLSCSPSLSLCLLLSFALLFRELRCKFIHYISFMLFVTNELKTKSASGSQAHTFAPSQMVGMQWKTQQERKCTASIVCCALVEHTNRSITTSKHGQWMNECREVKKTHTHISQLWDVVNAVWSGWTIVIWVMLWKLIMQRIQTICMGMNTPNHTQGRRRAKERE